MARIRAGTPAFAQDLLKILGLDGAKVRSIRLDMQVNRATEVEVEMYLTEDEASQIVETLKTKRFEVQELE